MRGVSFEGSGPSRTRILGHFSIKEILWFSSYLTLTLHLVLQTHLPPPPPSNWSLTLASLMSLSGLWFLFVCVLNLFWHLMLVPPSTLPYIPALGNIKLALADLLHLLCLYWELALILAPHFQSRRMPHYWNSSVAEIALIISSIHYVIEFLFWHFHLFSFCWHFLLFWFLW